MSIKSKAMAPITKIKAKTPGGMAKSAAAKAQANQAKTQELVAATQSQASTQRRSKLF